jgi:hypothetical protein
VSLRPHPVPLSRRATARRLTGFRARFPGRRAGTLVEEVIAALAAFREARVQAVILRAKPGARVLSAGHDIDE